MKKVIMIGDVHAQVKPNRKVDKLLKSAVTVMVKGDMVDTGIPQLPVGINPVGGK